MTADDGPAGTGPTIAVPDGLGRALPPGPRVELTVVVPTFNEAANVPILVERLAAVLGDIRYEVVFVDDDSPDGTGDVARAIAARDRRVRVISRIGRRGLASACVEGVLSSAAPLFVVMDGDLQHDDAALPGMVRRLRGESLDLVVGSRYLAGGTVEGLDERRLGLSRLATDVASRLLRLDLTDPMSGFFVMRRAAFDRVVRGLSQQGFKILLDILATARGSLSVAEVPVRFHPRLHGESKLDSMAAWEFGTLLLDKLVGRFVPVRFLLFAAVGGSGVLVNLAVLYPLLAAGLPFVAAQSGAVLAAMTSNFFLNNRITYRDRRLRGAALVRGLASFYAIGAVGAVANVGVANLVYEGRGVWWLAGVAGAFVGAVWNFAASSFLTWRQRR